MKALEVQTPGSEEEIAVPNSAMLAAAEKVVKMERITRFRGRPMLMIYEPFPHFVPLRKDRFDGIAYAILGAVPRSKVADVFAYISATAEDLSNNQWLIGFGVKPGDVEVQADTDIVAASKQRPIVWDMDSIQWRFGDDVDETVWRSPYFRHDVKGQKRERMPFVMQLAGGDEGIYDDIMQSLAPIVMKKKPDGVVWWVGDGANGKSTLMDAVYKIFPGQLSSITVKRLTDGRDTPSLNGTLANIVKESSEGRIDDTEVYKSIGTHENFRVHKFHSQDDIEIKGNLHHIFSANGIPVFNDKGFSARRRTFIVPFYQRFESDPGFEERTFTPEFFSRLISEMCLYAQQIKDQGYRYKWSAATLGAKEEYDTEANNAEEYAADIIKEGVVAFDSFRPVLTDYQNWCSDMGYVPLGTNNLRKAVQSAGFEKTSVRTDKGIGKHYRLKSVDSNNLQAISLTRPGLFTLPGFVKQEVKDKAPVVDFSEPSEPKKTVLDGKW